MLNKMMKRVEIFYLIIAAICLIECIISFINGDTKFGLMFLAGVVFGVSMSLTRRKMRLKMTDNNKPK